ncbi:PREDICTED: uncharacterized protein LOC108360945 isoform X2 [Rhagoletis zephyria]|uniref:uncharacterized protein LOC108360945 isoform X2 n=1 Tax=Rhagoletis zephyria TaxID=28612 RepID=UPI00081137DD|nr:PREDICTED: uncharacterized protein LOC108360945 isoform X2 [Rhagoletis zephyria]
MAPGVCVTSFRMLMRRTELCSHLCRGLRLTPTGPYLLNSWSTRRYCKQSDDASKEEQPQRTGKTKTVNENAGPTAKESSLLSKSMQAHNLNTNQLLKADENRSKEGGDLTQLKISQLRAELRAHGLSPVGKKDVLVQRLQSYLQLNAAKSITQIPVEVQDEQANADTLEEKASRSEKAVSEEKAYAKKEENSHEESTQIEIIQEKLSQIEPEIEKSIPTPPDESSLDKLNIRAANPHSHFEKSSEKTESSSTSFSNLEAVGIVSAAAGKNDGNDDSPDDDEIFQKHSSAKHNVEMEGKQPKGDVYVEYIQGLPHLTVPLPSRMEKCRFALRPVSHKVGDLIEMLKIEDHGIDRAVVLNKCGVRIASTCAIDSLMDEPFWLQINDNKYEVIPPKRKKLDSEDLKRLSDVRTLVAQLYEALHVGEYHLHKEQELVKKIENLKFEISPLEMEKQELTKLAERKTVIATWVGLSLMAVQFGVLARLTWWEYSWDIMEPVTYFVTYGTTMAIYAYYCLTKTEYNFESARDRLFLISIHKKAKRKNFDIEKYNILRRQIAEAEYDLRRLRDPINLQLPPHIDRSQRITSNEPPTSVTSEKKPVSFRLPFLEPKN